ncbi:MAG: hypothetical protein KF862_08960 [Chitinophagaceae bacterium]|nr:hypothetical protein [Chitinophagaceae bacterium]
MRLPLKIVPDTNVLLRSISHKSAYAIILEVDVYYHLNLISSDADDNKFSDCTFAGNVRFLVTNDKHFNVLRSVSFPSINIIGIDEFKELPESI